MHRSHRPRNAGTRFTDVDGLVLRPAPEARRTQAVPARAHARAPVPLQPGLRRMRQDPVPRPHPQDRSHSRRMFPRGRRMRRPHGLHPRRRAADASADRRDRRRPGGAQEIYLSLHQRSAAEREVASLQAQQIPDFQRPPRRPARRARLSRLPRRRLRHRRRCDQRSPEPRLPRHHQYHAIRRRRPQNACAHSSTT